uniref:Uncharacterized protein n=1 Tax=Romanomermis culicivorax TaxID=13658 RepID=A0A915IC54_ROMCU
MQPIKDLCRQPHTLTNLEAKNKQEPNASSPKENETTAMTPYLHWKKPERYYKTSPLEIEAKK